MKNTLALVLMVFGISGCQSAANAYVGVYANPLFTKEDKLSHAVHINDFKNVRKYVERSADINSTVFSCNAGFKVFCGPSLMASFQHEDKQISDFLIQSGGDINTIYPKRGSLFSRQVGFSPDTKMTTLGYWVVMSDEAAVKRVLAHKPDGNFAFDSSDSLLIFSTFNNNLNITRALLESGANPNYLNTNNVNALTVSVRHDNIKLSKLLISYGAKPDDKFWREVRLIKSSTEYIKAIYRSLGNTLNGSLTIGNSADIYNSEALVIDADGSRYEGLIKDGKANGKGIFYKFDGTTFEGSFVNGALTDGTISLNGNITKIQNSMLVDDGSAKRLKDEYIKTNNLQNSNEALKDVGEFVLGLAILPLYIVGAALSTVDWSEVVADLPEAHMRAKREQQRLNNAYIRGANAQRRRCNNQQGSC
ncbi:hypothetical protein N9K19_01245 [Gammaproteobacteria bacterium]|nr:hypothetical protein [Gammaproteobacteria bacterium]